MPWTVCKYLRQPHWTELLLCCLRLEARLDISTRYTHRLKRVAHGKWNIHIQQIQSIFGQFCKIFYYHLGDTVLYRCSYSTNFTYSNYINFDRTHIYNTGSNNLYSFSFIIVITSSIHTHVFMWIYLLNIIEHLFSVLQFFQSQQHYSRVHNFKLPSIILY